MSVTPIENFREGSEVSVYTDNHQYRNYMLTRITPTMMTIERADENIQHKIKKNKISLIVLIDDTGCDIFAEHKRVEKADHRRMLDNIKERNKARKDEFIRDALNRRDKICDWCNKTYEKAHNSLMCDAERITAICSDCGIKSDRMGY